ncbi:hypothetical protein EON77_03690 [bacterium]|nr:MAG: hypothetical protein EON77_03690 [bacterium]
MSATAPGPAARKIYWTQDPPTQYPFRTYKSPQKQAGKTPGQFLEPLTGKILLSFSLQDRFAGRLDGSTPMPHFSAYIDAMNAADALLEGSAQEVTDEARRMMVAAATKLRRSVASFQSSTQSMLSRERSELTHRCERFDLRLQSIARPAP